MSGTRPTSDRAREAVFSSLESMLGSFNGVTVLDLFAGSGAMGLEALSRGAARVHLVEDDRSACEVIRQNISVVDLPGATCHQARVDSWLASQPSTQADVVFCDPPYDVTLESVWKVLHLLTSKGHLPGHGVVVIERSSRQPPFQWPNPLLGLRDKRYGEAHLWFGGWAEPVEERENL